MDRANLNLTVLAQNRGCSVQHLQDEIALDDHESRDHRDDARIELLAQMTHSPEDAATVFSDWCSTHSVEEIGGMVLQAFAQLHKAGKSAQMPRELFAVWSEVVSPAIDRAANRVAESR